jgi:hypothetical protein
MSKARNEQVKQPDALLGRCFKRKHAFYVTLATSDVKSEDAVPTAAGVCPACKQLSDTWGIAFLRCLVNWRNAVVVALAHVAAASNKLTDHGGVTVSGSDPDRRSTRVVTLVHIALAGHQKLDGVSVAVARSNTNPFLGGGCRSWRKV